MSVQLHRGDCLELMKTLPQDSIYAVITDPPYGMRWNTNARRFSGGQRGHRNYKGNGINWGKGVVGDNKPFDPKPFLGFPKVVLFGYHHFASRLPVGSVLVWIKRNDKAFNSFLSDAELAWMKGGHGVYCQRDLSMNAEAKRRLHPTQKPVSLMKWVLDMAKVPKGATVFDPYMGSGTTGVACLQTGRNFIGCEIDGDFFAAAKKRIEEAETIMKEELK